MRTLRSNLIKMLTIALVVCLGVFVALIPMTKSPVSAEEVSFSITGEDMNGAQKGLKFVGSLTGTPDDYGILVYPESLDAVIDPELSIKDNTDALDALNFIKQSSVVICFNRDTMLTWANVTEDNVDEILNKFYAKDFVATPYYVVGGELIYGDSYVSNMNTVALAHVDSDDATEQKLAQQILGYEIVEGATFEGDVDFSDREDGFNLPVEIYVNGEVSYFVEESDGLTTNFDFSQVINTFNFESNVVDIRIVFEHEFDQDENGAYLRKTVCFNNAEYWTSIISNAQELKSALDITYSLDNLFNYGFYKMDADIDFAGHSFTYTGLDSNTLFNASAFNQYHEFGFAGQFDGCGHKISNIANNATSRGLFTNFVRGGASNPKAPVFVKNLAVINFTNNTAPVLALFANNFVTEIENIYVTYNYNAVPNGLINMPCGKFAKINNVLVAGSQTYRTPYTNYSWNVNMPIKSGAQYGDVSGIATGSTDDFYTVATLFNTLRWATPETVDAVTNVITVGHSPVAYQGAGISPKYAHQFKATDNGNGTYTHNLMNYGYPGNPYYPEDYIGYAGNDKVGNVLKITGINPAFAELASTSNGSALAGFYCATCYKTFSKEAGTCACGAELTQSANLWEVAGAYAYGVTDLTNYVNPDNTANNGEMVFYGVNRYNKVSELKSAFLADNSIYDSFISEAGQGMWKISTDGELVWHDEAVESAVFNEIDLDAYTGELRTSNLPKLEDIISIAIGSNELTVENGGIIPTQEGYKLNMLASGATETNGVPYIDNLISGNRITLKFTTSKGVTNYSNVNYITRFISDAQELKECLDITYTSTVKYNFGFYKLDADIDMTDVSFAYTDFSVNIDTEIGFGGTFDGAGYSIKNVGVDTKADDGITAGLANGLFANFVYSGNPAKAPKSQVTIKNLAFINWSDNLGPVLGICTSNHTYHSNAAIKLENIYVSYLGTAVVNGLIQNPGRSPISINNVVVNNPVTSDVVNNEAIYGEGTKGMLFSAKPFYAESTLFSKLRYFGTDIQQAIVNFISIGKSPLAYNVADFCDWNGNITSLYKAYFTAVDNQDGTYTHKLGTTGFTLDSANLPVIGAGTANEMYIGYASNETKGNVLNITGIKESFANLAKYSDGSALAGFYCATCYDKFSKEAGACDCGAELTQSDNLWNVSGAYTYSATDLTDYANPATTQNNGEVVFANTYRFDDANALKAAAQEDSSIYEPFTGKAGNGLWAVVDGILTWVGNAA